jgi:hypothetical protein
VPAPRRPRREDPPIRITTAPHNQNDDIDHRRRRYLLSMLIRTLCFVGAVIADGWLRWVLVAGAFVLPYVAVVMANSASPRIAGSDLVPPGGLHKEIEK